MILTIHTKYYSRFATLLLAMLVSALSGLSLADDTDIYFSGAGVQNSIPSVLFVLDTSSSMENRIDVNEDGDTDDPEDISRIEALRNAMQSLLSRVDKVRVGIMRMNGAASPSGSGTSLACKSGTQLSRDGQTYVDGLPDVTNTGNTGMTTANASNACYIPTGGSVMFPVSDLDVPVTSINGEDNRFSLAVPIVASSDDAEEEDPGNVVTDNTVMQMSVEQCAPASITTKTYQITGLNDNAGEYFGTVNDYWTYIGYPRLTSGFRFSAVDIPAGAKITNAVMRFTVLTNYGDVNTTIHGDMSNGNNPLEFIGTNNITTRNATQTTAAVDWNGIPTVPYNTTFQSPDISSIVQEIVDAPGWTPGAGQHMAFTLDSDNSTGFGYRRVWYHGSDPTKSADLEVSYCSPVAPDKSWVGLRFQDVGVPQGATITSASISLTAAVTNANVGVAGEQLDIRIENSSDVTNTFSNTFPDRVRDRPLMPTSIPWSGAQMAAIDPANPLWIQGDSYKTPELKTLVQAVVDRTDWCGGNSMGFHFEGRDTFPTHNLMRAIQSYDGDPGSAPVLNLTYDASAISGTANGCDNVSYSLPVVKGTHDAREKTDGVMEVNRSDMDLGTSHRYGVIFSLPVDKNTIVNDARLQFTLKEDESSSSATYYVNAQAADHAEDISSAAFDLSSRPRVLAGSGNSVTAQPSWEWRAGQNITLDVKSLVQSVINRDGWVKDNQIALFINENNGVDRRSWSYEGSVINAPRLLLDVRQFDTVKTVRDRLLEINDSMRNSTLLSWTPSVETLYESALYWRGKGVDFGKERGMARITASGLLQVDPLPAPAIDYRTRMHRTLTSHPGSWTGGTYVEPAAECKFSHDAACVQDYISGSPDYISPASGSNNCGKNYTIFLTDGAPTFTNDSTVSKITNEFSEFSSCSISFFENIQGSRGRCAVEMADALLNNDLDGDASNGKQTVKTYTIGFNLDDDYSNIWLNQIADAGGGQFFTANTSDNLLQVFSEIFTDVLGQPTSLAAPAVTTDFFNQTKSSDEVYFGVFNPQLEKRWDGNVKRFRICVDSSTAVNGVTCTPPQVADSAVLDRTGVEATDPVTHLFKDSSRSFWTTGIDGNITKKGGAGAQITDYTTRKIYTDESSSGLPLTTTSLDTAEFNFNAANWDSTSNPDLTHIHGVVCDFPATLTADSECENKMLWLLGKDVLDEDLDDITAETRWGFADSLHASPVPVTYGYTDSIINKDTNADGVPDTGNGEYDIGEAQAKKLLVNTNDGALRMINPDNGREDWRFMPLATLANVGQRYDNQQGTHVYGMDATPVLHIKDNNNNGVIEPQSGAKLNDTVHLYQVMRRGGNYLYALDITPAATLTSSAGTIVPKIRWRIQGGTGSYVRMGKSWSKPVLATINVDTDGFGTMAKKDVLIMGGGYDEDLDTNFGTSNSNPNLGNAIYIIDPDTGNKLLSISHKADIPNGILAGSGADIEISGLNHSVVSQISLIDSDDDGVDDRLYFSDTGGNVWRVDLGHDISVNGGLVVTASTRTIVGRLASLSTSGTAADERRLYNDLAAIRVKDTQYTDTTSYTNNSGADTGKLTYVILTSGYRANPLETVINDKMYALRDKIVNRMEDNDSDRKADGPGFILPIMDNTTDLADITNEALTKIGDIGTNDARDKRGYSFDFPDVGEKGLSRVSVLY
ncbi:MAG: PilC/PilY family type IV pilus protein, partial [Gammaproteobacteria bacterium]|nr:PilC/PilY family type IV pilus protein [Gammaproteobacteria bacterium]